MWPLNTVSKFACGLFLSSVAVFAQHSVILRVSPGSGGIVAASYGLKTVRNLDGAGDVQLVSFPDPGSMKTFTLAAISSPLILSVEVDQQTLIAEANSRSTSSNSYVSTSMDPLIAGSPSLVNYFGNTARQGYVQQPAAILIRVPDAHALYGSGASVVADIDTGVDAYHPLLANVFVPGYDFLTGTPGIPPETSDLDQSTVALLDQISPAANPTADAPFVVNQSTVALLDQSTVALLDQSTVALLDSRTLPSAFGHGTMVAGLIHLVAPGAQIMPLRAFHADGTGNLSDIVHAIYFAVDNGANVINMSFSATADSPALTAAIRYAVLNNVTCVAAAGNEGRRMMVYPAAIRGVIGVGSTDEADLRSPFSNYDSPADRTAAPGEALITSYPFGQYAGAWGTSFSTALVSGAVAMGGPANRPFGNWEVLYAIGRGRPLPPKEGLGPARLDVLSFLNALNNIQNHW